MRSKRQLVQQTFHLERGQLHHVQLGCNSLSKHLTTTNRVISTCLKPFSAIAASSDRKTKG